MRASTKLLLAACAVAGLSFGAAGGAAAQSGQPIKLGFTAELTGPLAINGKQMLVALEIWRDNLNARGGLLGRPVELVYYDDQSNTAMVPGIYTKLIEIDHVDLLFAQATNVSVPAMPTVIEHKMILMDTFAIAVNDHFHYERFFQIMPYGPDGRDSISRGYFEAAMTMNPKPRSVALIGADSEFSRAVLEGARTNARRLGLQIVYDQTYPPSTVDYMPVIRAIKAAQPDLVYFASYPADTVGLLNATREAQLSPKQLGGGMVGLQSGTLKQKLGEALNGIVSFELFVHEKTMSFPGIDAFLTEYQKRAQAAGTDPLGYYIPPFTYAAADILAQAVTLTGSLDQDKIAGIMHKTSFNTIVGTVKFGPDGEWERARMLTIQYQHVKGNDIDQFTRPGTQVILYPPDLKTGTLIYPFATANRP
jgi:branched-chain amino acid transport system substrate-binding protein